MRTRAFLAITLTSLLLSPLVAPVAAEWEEDAWLMNIIGPERLERGDEFGCHGIPGKDIRVEPEAIIECRNYLTDRTNASKWGPEPLSFGAPSGQMDGDTSDALLRENFRIVGDDVETPGGLHEVRGNGGSLEKNVGSASEFDDLVAAGEQQINFYWWGRNHDIVVRPDGDLVDSIESTTAWFTTWGERYSYSKNLDYHQVVQLPNGSWEAWAEPFDWEEEFAHHIDGPMLIFWHVPVTNTFSNLDSDVVRVTRDGASLPELNADSPHLQEGWRQSGSTFYLTLGKSNPVIIEFDAPGNVTIEQNTTEMFNGHELSITVAGHHTSDLFEWSRRWSETPMLFTWLVEPREVGGFDWWLPAIAVLVAISAPTAIFWLVRKDRSAADENDMESTDYS